MKLFNISLADSATYEPIFTVLAGGLLGAAASFIAPAFAGYFVLGGGVAALKGVLDKHVVPEVKKMLGISDYVQLPYSDYVQLQGYGDQRMIEQGRFQGWGTQAQVEAGEFGAVDDPTGTFAPSF